MAILGTGAVEREKSILFIELNSIWYPIGEDNESLTRTRNNSVSQTKNVLGKSKSVVAKGNQTTSVDPLKIARDDALGKELYEIDRLSKQLDELKHRFMEVSIFDEIEPGKFAAWVQDAKIDLKSWGGSNDGLYAPFDIVWEGDRVYGVYDQAENTFTPSTTIKTLSVVTTAGGESGTTIVTVAPSVSTGNHYRFKAGAEAETVTANQDLAAWAILAPGTELAATGAIITVAEVNSAGKAQKYGTATVVYGS